MAQNGVLRTVGDGMVGFWCPGCEEMHLINIDPDIRPAWSFNGNFDAPTFAPSINVTGVRRITDEERDRILSGEDLNIPNRVCHSFVRNGRIEFLGDCTHALANQTVELKPLGE